MRYIYYLLSSIYFISCSPSLLFGQKAFAEGIIIYNVSIESPDKQTQSTGTYTFIVKGRELRKELKMNNGYEDVIIYNGNTNTLYSLQTAGGKNYAIQLSMEDVENKQRKFEDFTIKNEGDTKKIIGYSGQKGTIRYKDGSSSVLYFTADWYPGLETMFDRMPGIKVMPLSFTYVDSKGMDMVFNAKKIADEPIDNSSFHVPADYKIISYNEYKQMNK